MSKIYFTGQKFIFALIILVISSACVSQKNLLPGTVLNKDGQPVENLETRLYLREKPEKQIWHAKSVTNNSGDFKLKARPKRSYILEISGAQGSGRIFLPAGREQKKLDVTYPVTEEIVFLHSNDLHFDLNYQDDFAQELTEIREKCDDVFLFSAGDIFVRHAHRWDDNGLIRDTAWYGQRSLQMINNMNELGYDLLTLGNHELAYINDYTRIALEQARFPVLAANIEISTDKLPPVIPYKILETSTLRRVAVLGLSYDNAHRDGIKQVDFLETTEKYSMLDDSSDVFLALSHLGLKKDKMLAENYSEFDAIIGGHSHDLLEEPLYENSVLIAQAGGNPHIVSDDNPFYVGKVVFTLENGTLTDKNGTIITFDGHNTEPGSSEISLPTRGLCAHRGAMETHPENTLAAFRAAVKAGTQMIEFDVQTTKDNKLVVMHDATVDRTTNGAGKVSELTLAEIRELDAGSWKSSEFKDLQVPTFREVLDEMPVNVWLNIHLKGVGEAPKMIAEILAKENRLHQAFLACGTEAASQARSAVPDILICNMERQESNLDYVAGTIEMNADFIQLRGGIIPDFTEYAKILKENGIRINYFGTDSPYEIKMLFNYGIDFPLVNDIISNIDVAKEAGIEPVKPVFR